MLVTSPIFNRLRQAFVLLFALVVCACSVDDETHNTTSAEHPQGAIHQHLHALEKNTEYAFRAKLHKAEIIAEVVIEYVESEFGTMGRAEVDAIWSNVTFKIVNALKLPAELTADEYVTLRFLGGRIGEQAMTLSHGPQFNAGERFLVITNRSDDPFVRLLGNSTFLRIENERVFSYDGLPIVSISEQGFGALPLANSATEPLPPRIVSHNTARVRPLIPRTARPDDALRTSEVLASLREMLSDGGQP